MVEITKLDIIYDFSKLAERITAFFGSRRAFAAAMGWSINRLDKHLKGKADWSAEDMELAADLLQIPDDEIPEYFFDTDIRIEPDRHERELLNIYRSLTPENREIFDCILYQLFIDQTPEPCNSSNSNVIPFSKISHE